jgi:hypothetical protein
MRLTLALTLALAAGVTAYDVPSLTPDNYDELTDGKTVFIKFFAPWVSLSFVFANNASLGSSRRIFYEALRKCAILLIGLTTL